jgi:hypothetical protein
VNRWLLNTFTTWELAIIVVGGFVLFAVVGLLVTERFAPGLRRGEINDVAGVILGVLAAIYGIVLALVIVSLFDDFHKTKSDIRTEASTLEMVYRDSRGFSPPVADAIKQHISDYIAIVQNQEWRDLSHGRESEEAWNELDGLYTILQNYQPTNISERVFYTEVVQRVNDLMSARRERLTDAEEGIPSTFAFLILFGAFLTLGFTFLFGVKNFRLHSAMAIAVAILIGFNLLVALELDYPFSGQVSVSSLPYSTGSLAQFAGGK